MGAEKKVYTLEEVSKHSDRKDCWLVIDGKVYDVTKFLEDHPGGDEVLLSSTGKDSIAMSSTFFILCNGFTGTCLFPLPIQIRGFNVLLSSTGKDATDDFDDVGHSTSARAMMDEYYVGDFDKAFIPAKTAKYTPPKQPHYNPDKTSDFIIRLLQFLVPLLILGLAFVVRAYTKSQTA